MDRGILPTLLGYQLRRTQQLVFQHFAANLTEFGVTPGQVGLLLLVEANPGVSQSALAKAIGVERASLGETVKHLAAAGHLEREPSPRDRRSNALHLTARGKRLVERIVPRIRDHERAVSQRLSEPERRALIDLLDRLGAPQQD